jgi:hypothetical protein
MLPQTTTADNHAGAPCVGRSGRHTGQSDWIPTALRACGHAVLDSEGGAGDQRRKPRERPHGPSSSHLIAASMSNDFIAASMSCFQLRQAWASSSWPGKHAQAAQLAAASLQLHCSKHEPVGCVQSGVRGVCHESALAKRSRCPSGGRERNRQARVLPSSPPLSRSAMSPQTDPCVCDGAPFSLFFFRSHLSASDK